jgi:hypothetical protein
MAKDSSNPAPTSRRHHLSPAAVVSLHSYRAALARGANQRTAAEHAWLPRSTLQDLDRVPAGADQALDAWLRTKTGWGFVRPAAASFERRVHADFACGRRTFP